MTDYAAKERRARFGRRAVRRLAAPLIALIIGLVSMAPPAGAAGGDPDLSVSLTDVSLSFWNPNEGDTVTITVQLGVNYSGEETGVVVEVLLDGGVEFLGEAAIGPDITGSTASFDWAAVNGTHTFTIVLDPHEDIRETDENNNTVSFTLTVKKLPESPPQFDWSPYVCGAFIVVIIALIIALTYTSWKKGDDDEKGPERVIEERTTDEAGARDEPREDEDAPESQNVQKGRAGEGKAPKHE